LQIRESKQAGETWQGVHALNKKVTCSFSYSFSFSFSSSDIEEEKENEKE
jgi:hypothetical protein